MSEKSTEIQRPNSQELTEIIGTPPSWLIRWGIIVVFLVLTMLVVATVFISYPDIVKTRLTVSATKMSEQLNDNHLVFFGEAWVPQRDRTKIKQGQRVLIKLEALSEDFGMIEGKVGALSDIAFADTIFLVKIAFLNTHPKKNMLKTGMTGSAEILTQETSLFHRLTQNFSKKLYGK